MSTTNEAIIEAAKLMDLSVDVKEKHHEGMDLIQIVAMDDDGEPVRNVSYQAGEDMAFAALCNLSWHSGSNMTDKYEQARKILNHPP